MVGVSGRSGKNSKAVREFKAAGNKAMQAGSFPKAMRLYTKALELDPGNPILYSNRSAAHFNTRQFSESLEDAESAILCDGMWWKAYKRKGLALIHMQRYQEAIEALEEGLKIIGKNAEMEKNLEFAKACQEQAQNLYILPEPHMMQRLESVPVFIVTDNVGQPFFVTYDDGQQVCTFYFDQEDANSTLDWIKSENPGLGDTARVIHITLHQAFNLAQETQKQYYEETTRAAAEEDMRAAVEAESAKKAGDSGVSMTATDVDGDEKEEGEHEDDAGADLIEEGVGSGGAGSTTAATPIAGGSDVSTEGKAHTSSKSITETVDADSATGTADQSSKQDCTSNTGDEAAVSIESGVVNTAGAEAFAGNVVTNTKEGAATEEGGELKDDDAIIDENAPLSFQFRPELRQVKIAVELLNKNPDPPVRPILRDPPSVLKAKAEAAAAVTASSTDANESSSTEGMKMEEAGAPEDDEAGHEGVSEDANLKGGKIGDDKDSDDKDVAEPQEDADDSRKSSTIEGGDGSDKVGAATNEAKADGTAVTADKPDSPETTGVGENGEDIELTVDNFNGIPIFQAKGLTLLQKNKQLIPLFFSKWDLEDAWKQLKESNAMDVPGECDIEVGTLEDVLRRMSESKTDEFQSVFFVPSRESMKAINVKFPLDDLASSSQSRGNGAEGKPVVKKAGFSRAKQIAARGGTKEEIRAAIREDLEKHRERQKMAEIIAQLEQARRTGGVNGLGRVQGAASSSSSSNSTNAKAGKAAKANKAGKTGTAA